MDIQIDCLPETWVQEALNEINACYATVWPLHRYNACNPLSGLENRAFVEALNQVENTMGVALEPMLSVLANVYFQKNFSARQWLDPEAFGVMDIEASTLQALVEGELYSTLNLQALPTSPQHLVAHQPDGAFTELHMRWIDAQLSYWLSGYFDEGQAVWPLPVSTCSHQGTRQFLATWCDMVLLDPALPQRLKNHLGEIISRVIKTTPSPLAALSELVALNQLNQQTLMSTFHQHARHLPGWVGYLKYLQTEPTQNTEAHLLEQYFCIRLAYQYVLTQSDWVPGPCYAKSASNAGSRAEQIQNGLAALGLIVSDRFINAYVAQVSHPMLVQALLQLLEVEEQGPLVAQLHQVLSLSPSPSQTHHSGQVTSQRLLDAVFCIDVRSEPYRLALEAQGQHQVSTLGFAGFFGLPIARLTHYQDGSVPQCPILLKPRYTILDKVTDAQSKSREAFWGTVPIRQQQWQLVLKKLRRDCVATFGYVEGLGSIHAWTLFRDSFLKPVFSGVWKKVRQWSTVQTDPDLSSTNHTLGLDIKLGMSIEEQVEWAINTLPLMGFDNSLINSMAKVVLICGHGAHSTNNPYASALHCGACGANDGTFNARVFCHILNNPLVRQGVNQSGRFFIPDETLFVAARHNTTELFVELISPDVSDLTDEQQQALGAVEQLLDDTNATMLHVEKTTTHYPTQNLVGYQPNTSQAAYDWSNTRPEWGLSGNNAFIIGRRQDLLSLDLKGRAFLHSYNWHEDTTGNVLEVILTAPAIVASWINLQYLFSTLHNPRFGSGKKYTHNVVGLLGTFQGNASDLQMGLPYESVFNNDGTPYHTPQRLLIHITAPVARVKHILSKHASINQLVTHQWVNLVVFDPELRQTCWL